MDYNKYPKQYIENQIVSNKKRPLKTKNGRINVSSLLKYGFKEVCVCCGVRNKLTVDHIIPKSRGGTDDVNNLQILCGKCNQIKGNKIISLNDLIKLR